MIKRMMAVLAPTLEKRRFIEEIHNTQRILDNDTLTPYRTTTEEKLFTGPSPFKSPQIVRVNSLVAKTLPQNAHLNFIDTVTHVLANLSSGFEAFERIASHTIGGTTLDKVGLSYRKATLIQVLGLIDFTCYYSRMVLLYTFGKEVKHFKSQSAMPESFTVSEIKYLEKHATNWARCLQLFSQSMAKILATIETVPDIVYDPTKEAAIIAQVGHRLDPLSMNYIPVLSDVFLFFGLRYAERRALRYLKADADKKALELRIAQYRSATMNADDAVTDKMILVAEDEMRALDYELKQMRKKMGIDE